MTSSKTFVKNLCMDWFPKAIVLFFQCCNIEDYKCNSSPAWWRSFSIPKVPRQWGCTSCFLKVPTQQVWYHQKKRFKQQNFMHGKAIVGGCYQWQGCTLIHLMQSPDFGNALHLGPYIPCKRHCLGDYVNQPSPVHHPLATRYDKPNFLGAKFHQIVIQIQIPHQKFPFFCMIICPLEFFSAMNHQSSISE